MRRAIATYCVVALGIIATMARAVADVGDPVTKTAAFDDVRFELGNAITSRGLAVHAEGNLGKMLQRTGADVGSTKPVYKQAEFVEVCSAKHARSMVEADPSLISNCPFLFYVFEHVERPGEVVVGFRRLHTGRTAGGAKAVGEAEAMLDAIVRDSIK